MRRFDLSWVVGDEELDLAVFLDINDGSWRLVGDRHLLATGNLLENEPERFSGEFQHYRWGLATGLLTIPPRTLGEIGGLSRLLGGKPAPELDDLVMPGIRCPVIHVFVEVPGLKTGGIARVSCFGEMSFISSQNVKMGVDLESFFKLCEQLFMLPPQE